MGNNALAALLNILSELYPEKQSARRIVDTAGLNAVRIAFDGKAIDCWHAIWAEAMNDNKHHHLIWAILSEYKDNRKLFNTYIAYLDSRTKIIGITRLTPVGAIAIVVLVIVATWFGIQSASNADKVEVIGIALTNAVGTAEAAIAQMSVTPTVTPTPTNTPMPTPTMAHSSTPTLYEVPISPEAGGANVESLGSTEMGVEPIEISSLPTTVDVPKTIPEPFVIAATETWTNPMDGAIYVRIPAGKFLMGASDKDELAQDDEQPQHPVHINEFWMMQTEVTNEQYTRCVLAQACTKPDNNQWNDPAYAKHPVTNVTWIQAKTYAEWAGGRLPTEAEWEKACRGTDDRIYPWGGEAPSPERLNHKRELGDTTPVRSYPPGANNLYDMAGNVWEWTADWYDSNYYNRSPTSNPTGSEIGDRRTLRGGSWFHSELDVRCAHRGRDFPYYSSDSYGFRVIFSSPNP